MEESAPKRRRTSPRTRVSVEPTPTATTREATGATAQDATATELTEETTALLASSPRRPRRKTPSFASPTKASLSRHNPEILSRRQHLAPPAAETEPPASRPGSAEGEGDRADGASEERRGPQAPENAREGDREIAFPPGTATQPLSSRSTAGRVSGGLAARPRRSPIKPDPRPLPPPGPDEDEELINPPASRARLLPRTGVLPINEGPAEPELPPTPVQLGLEDPVVTTPPSGIHSSSPSSKRAKRSRRSKPKSSPLKQPPVRPPELVEKRAKPANTSDAPRNTVNDAPDDNDTSSSLLLPTTHPARGVARPRPHADKLKLRDELRREEAALRADLEMAATENERLRQMHPRRRSGVRGPLPLGRDDLVRLIQTHLLPPEEEHPLQPSQEWLDAAMNPVAWLPFGKPMAVVPNPGYDEDELEDLPRPRSHHPLPMTAQEELPFLQVFTNLSFSSSLVMLPREQRRHDDNSGKPPPLLQKHLITVRSAAPPGLFAARIEMTVDAKSLAVTELEVPRLDPAAAGELGPFVEDLLRRPRSAALARNVTVVCWAMGEWLRVAVRRAAFWAALEAEAGSEERLLESAAKMRRRTARRRKAADDGEGPRTAEEVGEEEDGAEATTEKATEATGKLGLLPHLGQTSMEIRMPGTHKEPTWLRVEWRIEFDWAGEARSKMAALVGVPGKWRRDDTRGDLARIPGIFDKLVHAEDPMTAVQSLVALLAGGRDT